MGGTDEALGHRARSGVNLRQVLLKGAWNILNISESNETYANFGLVKRDAVRFKSIATTILS